MELTLIERVNQAILSMSELDLSKIDQRLAKKLENEDRVQGLKQETLRYLGLAVGSNEPIVPSDDVDIYWHELILNTPIYQEVGRAVGRFIHHNPTDKPGDMSRTFELYEQVFKEEPNSEYWSIAADCDSGTDYPGGRCTPYDSNI